MCFRVVGGGRQGADRRVDVFRRVKTAFPGREATRLPETCRRAARPRPRPDRPTDRQYRFGRAGRGQFHGHRLGPVAGIEDQASLAGRVGQAAERFDQPAAFRIIAPQSVFAFADDNVVHAAQPARPYGCCCPAAEGGSAVGNGDRAPAKTHRSHAATASARPSGATSRLRNRRSRFSSAKAFSSTYCRGVAADRAGQELTRWVAPRGWSREKCSETSVRIVKRLPSYLSGKRSRLQLALVKRSSSVCRK